MEKKPKSNLDMLFNDIDKEKKKKIQKNQKTPKTKPNFKLTDTNNGDSFKGLTNFGNSCYSNVIIQILTSLDDFLKLLQDLYQHIENDPDLFLNFPIVSRLYSTINFYKLKNTSMATKFLKEIVDRFDPSRMQNDAHEFLVFIFDNLDKEFLMAEEIYDLKKKPNNAAITANNSDNKLKDQKGNIKPEEEEGEWEEIKKNGKRMIQVNDISNFTTSILGDVFQGILKQDVISKGKSTSNCQIEPFYVLSLDLGVNNLDLIFQKFFERKKIEGSDKHIQTYLEKIPQIFILNIKGIYYDKKLKRTIKITDKLEFNDTLILKKNYFSPCINENKDINYELIGLVIHKGTKANEGHYICYCKDVNKNIWWCLDDKKAFTVGEESIHSCRPYIMFYKKKI